MKLQSAIKIGFLTGLLFFTTHAFSQTDQTTGAYDQTVRAMTPEDDTAITNTLKKLIHETVTLSKLNVEVSTSKGVITLKGNVDSDTQVGLLVEHAESIIGVIDVDASQLTVKDSKQPLVDTIITAKIKGLFIREKLFGEKDIAAINTSVETKDGVVYLSGVVDNQQQIDNAIEIIKKSVPEVKKVEYSVKKVTPIN